MENFPEPAGDVLERLLERAQRDRLRQKCDETRVSHRVGHPRAGQRDAAEREPIAKLLHQLVAAAIGQTDVADDEIERLFGRARERIGRGGGDPDRVALALEQLGEQLRRVGVILDEKQTSGLATTTPTRPRAPAADNANRPYTRLTSR